MTGYHISPAPLCRLTPSTTRRNPHAVLLGRIDWTKSKQCGPLLPLSATEALLLQHRLCTTVHRLHTTTTILLQPFNGPLSGTTRVRRYQKGKTNLDFTGARDSEWQWHQLGHMQVCTSLQTDNHASTPPLCLLQAGCPSCHPTYSVKALKATYYIIVKKT